MTLKMVRSWQKKDGCCRNVVKAALSGILNGAYASFNLVLAWVYRDEWYLMMAAFLFPFCIIRFLIFMIWKNGSGGQSGLEVLHSSGVIMLFLDAVMAAMVYIASMRQVTEGHREIIMIAIAAYTFTKLGLAFSKAVSHKKDERALLKTIRCMTYAETAASMLNLQRSMIVSFGNENQEWARMMNIACGTAVCLFMAAIGISMIKYGRNRNEIKNRGSK